MSYELILYEILSRQDVFNNIDRYLRLIVEVVKSIDENASIYLFGSVAEGKYIAASDIDVLIITRLKPSDILVKLWEAGIGDPFEIHIQPPEKLKYYEKKAYLKRIA